ncbi:MAG: hypothetical protein V4696_10300 [Pseudomonadota bacterium]
MIPAIPALAALRARWKLIAGLGGLIALAVLLMLLRAEKRHSAKLEGRIVELIELRKADHANYTNAQSAAKAKNEAQVARIEVEQERITDAVSQDYAGDLARLRTELGRVRNQTAPAAQRSAGDRQASQGGNAPARADGDGVPIPTSDDLPAAEIELRLMHLQNWVEEQGKVER